MYRNVIDTYQTLATLNARSCVILSYNIHFYKLFIRNYNFAITLIRYDAENELNVLEYMHYRIKSWSFSVKHLRRFNEYKYDFSRRRSD